MNHTDLIGRLTKTPDLKRTSNGTAVTSFALAVDGYNKHTDFINCVAWKNTAEMICKYFVKGQRMGVSGRISTRPYEKGDVKLTLQEVTVESVDFCESKKSDKPTDVSAEDFEDLDDSEDLPF
jgi:single-strand DNA-binding protein